MKILYLNISIIYIFSNKNNYNLKIYREQIEQVLNYKKLFQGKKLMIKFWK